MHLPLFNTMSIKMNDNLIIRRSFRRRMTKAPNEDLFIGRSLHHQYASNFDDFGTIVERV